MAEMVNLWLCVIMNSNRELVTLFFSFRLPSNKQ